MVFRTELNVNNSLFHIGYKNQILFLGSCFSDHIGHKFQSLGFKCLVNPFGTVFNIASIRNVIDLALSQKTPKIESLDFTQGVYSHRDFHSRFNSPVAEETVGSISDALGEVDHFLGKVDTVFLTLGTAWVYRSKKDGHIVSNCHKLPSSLFEKELLSSDQIVEELHKLIHQLTIINPAICIILTISPVRHIKDGIIENQVSKARLINAVYDVCHDGRASYFPAYEFMVDDLRDYRFYKEDMIHPNDQAIEYIWEKLANHYFDEHTQQVIKSLEKMSSFLHHRPIYLSQAYIDHKASIQAELIKLEKEEGIDASIFSTILL